MSLWSLSEQVTTVTSHICTGTICLKVLCTQIIEKSQNNYRACFWSPYFWNNSFLGLKNYLRQKKEHTKHMRHICFKLEFLWPPILDFENNEIWDQKRRRKKNTALQKKLLMNWIFSLDTKMNNRFAQSGHIFLQISFSRPFFRYMAQGK